jgi:hypothetical protein
MMLCSTQGAERRIDRLTDVANHPSPAASSVRWITLLDPGPCFDIGSVASTRAGDIPYHHVLDVFIDSLILS